jgi:hypothetical protein
MEAWGIIMTVLTLGGMLVLMVASVTMEDTSTSGTSMDVVHKLEATGVDYRQAA